MKSSSLIVIVIVAAFVLIGYLFAVSPTTAPAQLPLLLAGAGALITLLIKQGDTDTRVEAAKAEAANAADEAVRSTAASKQNAQAISAVVDTVGAVSGQVEENTSITHTTHDIVNSRMDEFKRALEEIAGMKIDMAAASAALAVAKAELATANDVARAILQGREQVTTTIAAERDAVAAAAPAHDAGPTTFAPAGPTTIVVDATQPVTIVPPDVP